MRVTGIRPEYNRKTNKNDEHEFSFEAPAECHVQFDASQSTLTLRNNHGHVLLALKGVNQYWVDSIDVSWTTPEDQAARIEQLQKQVAQLQQDLNFHKEVSGVEDVQENSEG